MTKRPFLEHRSFIFEDAVGTYLCSTTTCLVKNKDLNVTGLVDNHSCLVVGQEVRNPAYP